jgi:hypothetical protein
MTTKMQRQGQATAEADPSLRSRMTNKGQATAKADPYGMTNKGDKRVNKRDGYLAILVD